MIDIADRNKIILQMWKEGVKQSEIAKKFRVSKGLIGAVLKEIEVERALLARRAIICREFRKADDPDRRWPVVDILDSVDLTVKAKAALDRYFRKKRIEQMSLREFMDMAVGSELVSPLLYSVRGIGKIGYCSVVNQLTELDMGKRCTAEWQTRFEKIKRRWKVTGPFPYSEAWLAQFRRKK